jgi:soluble lytic murein transglycosylase-like protein
LVEHVPSPYAVSTGRLLITACFAVRILAAESTTATVDPFAVYQQAVESQLSATLEDEEARPPTTGDGMTVQESAKPAKSDAGEIELPARQFWGGRQAELAAALRRLQQFRPVLESVLTSEDLPKQLIAVALIESGADPLAISRRRARGTWQLIPETARRYGLTVNAEEDERVRVVAATRAAARYLRDLNRRFGDWPLALAAYNACQKAVEDALEKGRATTFWQLSSAGLLPVETQRYVPAVLSAMQLLGSKPPADTGTQPPRENWIYASASSGY